MSQNIALAKRREAARLGRLEHLKAVSKDGPPATTLADVEMARRDYADALEHAQLWRDARPDHPAASMSLDKQEAMVDHATKAAMGLPRLRYEEVRERYEDQERRKAAAVAADLAQSNYEVAKAQKAFALVSMIVAVVVAAAVVVQTVLMLRHH